MLGIDSALFEHEVRRTKELTALRQETSHLLDKLSDSERRIFSLQQEIQKLRAENFKLQADLITHQGISEMRENMIEFYRKLMVIPTMTVPNADRSTPAS